MIYALSWLPFALLIVLLVLRPLLSKIVVLPDGSYEVDTGESSAIVPIAGMGIAGSIMVGALMNWGAISAAIDGGTPATPPSGASTSFACTIYDMDYAGITGDTLVLQGLLMPKGAIDTAHVVDSVEVQVEGAEVGAYVEHRGEAYSDGSARVLYTQFRADPSTETTANICYSGCTVDSVRITEQSWAVKGDTTLAVINSGDSTGIRTGRRGYHPVMCLPTDSAWLVDAYPQPLATIEEAQAITGTAALAVDTVLQRIRDYGDLFWDSTTTARISGDTPDGAAYSDIKITVDGTSSGCLDWTNSSNGWQNWLRNTGEEANSTCFGYNYYDRTKLWQQYGVMRSADSVGVEFLRRSFAMIWHDLMYWHPRISGGNANRCDHGEINKRPPAWGYYNTYVFTGDEMYRDQLDCLADAYGTNFYWIDMGDNDSSTGNDGRVMGFTTTYILTAYLANTPSQNWGAKLDTAMVRMVYGNDGTPAFQGGVIAPDSAASGGCTGTYNANNPPFNSEFLPVWVLAQMQVKWVMERDTFAVGSETDTVSQVVTRAADTMSVNKTYEGGTGYWVDSTASYLNYFNGNACQPNSSWTDNAHDIAGIHAFTQYAKYAVDSAAGSLSEADSVLQRIMVSRVATTQFSSPQGPVTWDAGGGIRDHSFNNALYTFLEAIGWRNYTQGN